MGIRFRQRFKIAPGIRLNVSGSGLSLSVGPRGASMTFGSRGTYLNAGIPGSGIYSRQRLGQSGHSSKRSANSDDGKVQLAATISVEEDGTVTFRDSDGRPLSDYLIQQAKKQHKDVIVGLMENVCSKINAQIEALEQIHLPTPAPDDHPVYKMRSYEVPVPSQPIPTKHGVMGTLFSATRQKIDKENQAAQFDYLRKRQEWLKQKEAHDARELAHKALVEDRVLTELPAMEIVLEESLKDISWPRETSVSTEIRDNGQLVMVDIDLPEIEELPRKTASVLARGYKLSIKELSPTRYQQLYMRHVHGIGFRIIGEVFAVLPKVNEVVLSGYSQRPDKATGVVHDQYLYSVRVLRSDWARINFANLAALDVVEALGRFDMRREITKSGLFKEIAPFGERSGIEQT